MEIVQQIAIEKIDPAPEQRRRSLGDLSELTESIKSQGVLEPLLLSPSLNGRFLAVAGSRRLAAAKQAGLKEVPAIVRETDERQRQEIFLVENLQRKDLAPLEEAAGYQALMKLGLSQHLIATRVGVSQSHISKRVALLQLPNDAKQRLDSGRIKVQDAEALTRLLERPDRLKRALKDRNIGEQVEWELEDQEREDGRNAIIQELKRQGVKVIAYERHQIGPPKGYEAIRGGGGYSYFGLSVDPVEHAKESCHAVGVGWDGETQALCAKPDRHKAKGESEVKRKPSRAEARKSAHEKALKEARKARHVFLSKLLTRRLPRKQVVDTVARGLIARSEYAARQIACEILGLEPKKRKQYGSVYRDYEKPLLELAARGPAELLKVSLAVAFASEELRVAASGPWYRWGDHERDYFVLLKKHGYHVSPAEKRELGRKAPR